MNEPLLPEWSEKTAIRHGKILAEVTGMDTKEIWEYLIDFVLWGSPDPDNMISYRLFWAWKAIVMLQEWEKGIAGWALPDQVASNVLGWDYKKLLDSLPKSDQLTVTYAADTWIASTVYLTVEKFIKQSDVPYLEDVPKYPEVGQWYWYKDGPAFIFSHRFLPLIEILVPKALQTPIFVRDMDRPALEAQRKYTTNWVQLRVPPDEIQKVRLDKAELEY